MYNSLISPLAFLMALVIASLSGCSFSESSTSLSGSSASLSESIASSASSTSSSKEGIGKDKIPYRDDVANLTYSVVNSSMTSGEFPTALARTARQYKISAWAQEKATYYGIGKGLRKAGIPKEKVATLPLLGNVLNANSKALSYIQEGYKN